MYWYLLTLDELQFTQSAPFQHGLVVFPHDQRSVFVETDSDVIHGYGTAIPMTPSNSPV